MATISVLDSTGAAQTVAKVASTGATTGANALPVVIATDDAVMTGMSAKLPATIGTKVAASSMSVVIASDDAIMTGISAKLPATLGSKSAANSISVTQSTEDAAKHPSLGAAADAASVPVSLSTESKALLGATNESAAATDTSTSGLNGLIKRLNQRLTSLIALTPALGAAADAASSPVSLSTESKALLGATNEGAAATDTSTSGLNGLLKRIAQNLTTVNTTLGASNSQLPSAIGPTTKAGSLSVAFATDMNQLPLTASGSVQVTITRPANTTAYTANDVLGGALTFATGLTSGQRAMIAGVDLMPQIGAIPSGMTSFTLHLYNVTPPSALADNAAFDLPSGDRASYLGAISVGTPADLGSTLFVETNNINKAIQLSGSANVFGYLVTAGAFTPAANSEVYLIRLQLLGL